MITVVNANALQIPLPDQSVQCVITSPPYWGLRDYGTATWEGGSAECDHIEVKGTTRGGPNSTLSGGQDLTPHNGQYKSTCPRCGARRIDAQIGLEPTPAAYVANIVRVMRECWRVLRDDGTLWLNLGDSYARDGGWSDNSGLDGLSRGESGRARSNIGNGTSQSLAPGLKEKDLCGIPWRVAFALQDDGWYLRSDIIWAKPNPMPESVTDRPTKAHEYVFLLTKQPRYYYDAEAIKEDVTGNTHDRGSKLSPPKEIENAAAGNGHKDFARYTPDPVSSRNRRTVWTVATSPYSGAHFATFPPALVEPMILAGTSQRGACPTCGAGWVRVFDREYENYRPNSRISGKQFPSESGAGHTNGQGASTLTNHITSNTLGWQPACACYAVPPLPDEPDDKSNGDYTAYLAERERLTELYTTLPTVPCRVLDPFCGTATVGRVCAKHGRDFIGTELNPKYITLADERTSKIQIAMTL